MEVIDDFVRLCTQDIVEADFVSVFVGTDGKADRDLLPVFLDFVQ